MASIAETLRITMQIDPLAEAIEHGNAWWSWGDLDKLQRSIRQRLDEAGAGNGARIGILLRSRPGHVAALLACVLGGRCAVAFNSLLPPERLASDLRDQNVAVLIGERSDLERPEVMQAIDALSLPAVSFEQRPGHDTQWANSARQASSSALERRGPGILIEMLTSGTTGAPKRIPLGSANFEESLRGASAFERNRSDNEAPKLRSGVRIVTAPLTHISGISVTLLTLAAGRKVCLLEKFSVDEWVSAIQRHRAKVANAPPAALRMLLDANVPAEALSSLVALRSGTAPLDSATIDAFLERYKIPVLGQYGATEFAGVVAGWSIDDFRAHYASKRGSVGRFQSNIEGRIANPETGEVLPPGAPGVLELRGSQIASSGEWVRTTDRATIDAEGFLYILGRVDHAINRGGFKIHPDEIVRALQEHPAIREAVVVGLPDARLGEVPAAMAMLTPGKTPPGFDELAAFLKGRLLSYQIPVCVKFVADLPRNPSLKPSIPDVRRLLEADSSEGSPHL